MERTKLFVSNYLPIYPACIFRNFVTMKTNSEYSNPKKEIRNDPNTKK